MPGVLERGTPKGHDIHLIYDNCSTDKHAKVLVWIAKRPRFHPHLHPDLRLVAEPS